MYGFKSMWQKKGENLLLTLFSNFEIFDINTINFCIVFEKI